MADDKKKKEEEPKETVVVAHEERQVGPTREEKLLQQASKRTLLERRFKAIEDLFGRESVEERFGSEFVKKYEATRAYIVHDLIATLGGDRAGDREKLSPENREGYRHILERYENLRRRRTVVNDTGEDVELDGKIYKPNETIHDGRESPLVMLYALDCMTVEYDRMSKSFTSNDTDIPVLYPGSIFGKDSDFKGYTKKSDSLEKKAQS
jgi:hypothetical protein